MKNEQRLKKEKKKRKCFNGTWRRKMKGKTLYIQRNEREREIGKLIYSTRMRWL